MLGNGVTLPNGLSLRATRASDAAFLATLYHSTRDDLQLIDDRDLSETLIEMQQQAQTDGYGESWPEALHFIVGLQQSSIGRLIVDFSRGTVHIVDISLIPEARGQGYGATLVNAMQMAAEKIAAPVTLSVHQQNVAAQHMYQRLGFAPAEYFDSHILLRWQPAVTQALTGYQ